MRKRIAIELALVCVALFVAGWIWLSPSSGELLAGNAATMVGDGTDSVTNVWQYQLLLDTFHRDPARLLFGALYTEQLAAPDGLPVFVPYSERLIVLVLAMFMRVELMPTTVVWIYVVASGLAMHVCARLFGWSRTISFALALAWCISPHVRARSVCHIALTGVYFAPAAAAAVRILAASPAVLGWSRRTEVAIAAALFAAAASAAHYYAILLVCFGPAFVVLYLLLLPRGARKLAALGRLAVAAAPAFFIVVTTARSPLPRDEAREVAKNAVAPELVKVTNDNALRIYGAHVVDFFAGDVRYGDRDLNPIRAAITRDIRATVGDNRHERTNGIRWAVLACWALLTAAIFSKRIGRRFTAGERRFAKFLLGFGVAALAVSIGPTGLRHHDVDLGPALLLARLVPQFRIPNRAGVLVHFAALLAAGTVVTALASRAPGRWRAFVPAIFAGLVVVEYLPLHPVSTAPVSIRRDALEPSPGACGVGITVPYVTYGFQVDHYYRTIAELRGTSCKLVHAQYLAAEDERLVQKLSTRAFSAEDLSRAVAFAKCTRASWAIFRLDAPASFQREFCDALGWTPVSPDACRGAPDSPGPPRSVRECAP